MSINATVLILIAHPQLHRSRVNKQLIKKARDVEGIIINDLYENYPDYYINVAREQSLLMQCSLVIFQHPLYWYSSPAILKQWQDVVLERGFAYGKNGIALRNKDFMLAVSTGAAADAYQQEGLHGFAVDNFLRPLQQTALLCGMRYHPPFLVQNANNLSNLDILRYAQDYQTLLESYVKVGSDYFGTST